jgi:hypothetical protein
MAVYTIKVSLAVQGGNNTLVLTPTFCEVDLDQGQPSRIAWVLDDGANAKFVLPPGNNIDWELAPAKGIFDDFDHDSGMKILSIRDNHFGRGKFGQWRYRLTVKKGRLVYRTPADGSGHKPESEGQDDGKHPVIINR